MTKNKRALAALAALLAIAALMAALYLQSRGAAQGGTKSITVTVVHSGGDAREFSLETRETYLAPVLLEAELVSGDDGPYGLYITEADGESAVYEENGSYWALYVGDEYASQGVSETPVRDGDRYSLVYTVG